MFLVISFTTSLAHAPVTCSEQCWTGTQCCNNWRVGTQCFDTKPNDFATDCSACMCNGGACEWPYANGICGPVIKDAVRVLLHADKGTDCNNPPDPQNAYTVAITCAGRTCATMCEAPAILQVSDVAIDTTATPLNTCAPYGSSKYYYKVLQPYYNNAQRTTIIEPYQLYHDAACTQVSGDVQSFMIDMDSLSKISGPVMDHSLMMCNYGTYDVSQWSQCQNGQRSINLPLANGLQCPATHAITAPCFDRNITLFPADPPQGCAITGEWTGGPPCYQNDNEQRVACTGYKRVAPATGCDGYVGTIPALTMSTATYLLDAKCNATHCMEWCAPACITTHVVSRSNTRTGSNFSAMAVGDGLGVRFNDTMDTYTLANPSVTVASRALSNSNTQSCAKPYGVWPKGTEWIEIGNYGGMGSCPSTSTIVQPCDHECRDVCAASECSSGGPWRCSTDASTCANSTNGCCTMTDGNYCVNHVSAGGQGTHRCCAGSALGDAPNTMITEYNNGYAVMRFTTECPTADMALGMPPSTAPAQSTSDSTQGTAAGVYFGVAFVAVLLAFFVTRSNVAPTGKVAGQDSQGLAWRPVL